MFADAFTVGVAIGLGVAIAIVPAWLVVMWAEHELARRRAHWGRRR